ncbi:shikimate kinase [Nonlabens dokdonensis]|jgi:shikimate kinase
MGSGKSTVGELLSSQISFSFFDLDHEIEQLEKKSVTKIFDENGVIYFRKIENKVLDKIINSENDLVLSLGGGTPCYYDTMNYLNSKENIKTIYLDVPIPVLVQRLFAERSTRPLIEKIDTQEELTEFIGKHLFERREFYRQAKMIISVADQSPTEIAARIETLLFQ